MLYTGKGDDGTTSLFHCDQRLSKGSAIAEALGTVDELNALLGVVKLAAGETPAIDGATVVAVLDDVQQDLFVVQAELAGADKRIDELRVKKLEVLIGDIEAELPKITTFFVAGGTGLAAYCDLARTISRRAERRVVAALEGRGSSESNAVPSGSGDDDLSDVSSHKEMMAYMNRLSSLLYALARLVNHRAGVVEEKPHY